MQPFIERRRSLRIPLPASAEFREKVAMPIRLLDISLAGVLMSAPQQLNCGQTGRLNARLESLSIDAEIEITWVGEPPSAKQAWLVGARFLTLDEPTRTAMEHFLDNVPR